MGELAYHQPHDQQYGGHQEQDGGREVYRELELLDCTTYEASACRTHVLNNYFSLVDIGLCTKVIFLGCQEVQYFWLVEY